MSYNKHGTGARIGNWAEEEALKEATGIHRVTTVGDRSLDTKSRVIAHYGAVEAKDYKSTSAAAGESVKNVAAYAGRAMGARERALERKLAEEAREAAAAPRAVPVADFSTEASDSFVRHGEDLYKSTDLGFRITKPATGSLATTTSAALLRETSGGASAAALAASFPISYHTQTAAKGGYGMTSAGAWNPFLRDTRFTNPIAESDKSHAEAEDIAGGPIIGVGSSAAVHAGSELTMVEVLEKLKAAIRLRGGDNGIKTLSRILKRMDSSGDGALSPEEFADGLRDMGIAAPAREINALVAYFDTDRSGKISLEEFQKGLAPPLNAGRLELINEAFRRLDKTGDGVVTIADLASAYDTSQHPGVKMGEVTPEQVLREFLDNFDSAGDKDGVVTAAEFTEYYRGVSANIPRDDYFELMMRNAWRISGGTGWSENTTCKRVLVIFAGGEQRVIEIKDDLGMRHDDLPAIKARLRKQGVTDFVDVKLFE